MADGSPCNDPRSTPAPIPAAGVFDDPTVTISINAVWAGHLDGLLGRLLQPDAWTGTDEDIDAAIQEVYKLMVALALSEA